MIDPGRTNSADGTRARSERLATDGFEAAPATLRGNRAGSAGPSGRGRRLAAGAA